MPTETAVHKPIVLFSARYLPSMGGVENFTAHLGHQLASQGHEVLIVTTEQPDQTSADERMAIGTGSLEVLRLASWGPARIPFVRWNSQTRACLKRIEQLGTFSALINTRFYDLSRVAARLCKRCGVRPVLVDHGTGYIKFPNKLLSTAFVVAEHAVTTNLKRYPIDYYGVSKDASHWLRTFGIDSCGEIHNALDASAFATQASDRDFRGECGVAPDALCVAYAARLLPEKGADVIMEATQRLVGVHFFVAGSGPLEEAIAEAAATMPNLTYVGRLGHPDLAALLIQSDVFCFPTRYAEGLPTTLLEAASCHCALVASHAGGVDEIIPSRDHGMVLGNPTTSEVCDALSLLSQDRDLLTRLQDHAYQQVCEHFTWESTADEVVAAFLQAAR